MSPVRGNDKETFNASMSLAQEFMGASGEGTKDISQCGGGVGGAWGSVSGIWDDVYIFCHGLMFEFHMMLKMRCSSGSRVMVLYSAEGVTWGACSRM
jgi:hypothetical protein